jgi:hypothetical protein
MSGLSAALGIKQHAGNVVLMNADVSNDDRIARRIVQARKPTAAKVPQRRFPRRVAPHVVR